MIERTNGQNSIVPLDDVDSLAGFVEGWESGREFGRKQASCTIGFTGFFVGVAFIIVVWWFVRM